MNGIVALACVTVCILFESSFGQAQSSSSIISSTGHFFVANPNYQPNVSTYINELHCQRRCAVSQSCQAYFAFTDTILTRKTPCYLYMVNNCVPGQISIALYGSIVLGRLWNKVKGELVPQTCLQSQNTTIASTLATSPTASTNTITASKTASATVSATSEQPAEPRPRTCWDYYAYNGTLDVPGYGAPRPIWPTGFSNGTSITAYCRNGYTAIILNHIVLGGTFPTVYDNKNDVTVFGSTTQRLPSTNTTVWNAYISSINFPILSALVRASNRTLYYEQQADFVDAVGIYSGLDIAPDGTLTVQGILEIVKGSPSNGFSSPVVNSSWANGTCGSAFWKIPVTSTDICNQTTNLLLPAQYQKVGGTNRRSVGLAFR